MLQSAVPLMSGDMHAKLGAYYTSLQCHFAPAEAEAIREQRAMAREYAAVQHTQSRETEARSAHHVTALREAARQRHRERMASTRAAR